MSINLAAVKASLNLTSVAETLLNEQPVKHKIHCPWHNDATPSLHLYDDGRWHCFSCGRSGDVLDIAGVAYYGNSYDPDRHLLDVIERLSGLQIRPATPKPQPTPAAKTSLQIAVTISDARRWHETMPAERLAYWQSRGIEPATAAEFMLGWDGRRYTIPVTFRDVLVAVKRRRADDVDDGVEAKYMMSAGSRTTLFNGDVLLANHDAGLPLFIVEGEIEAMLLHQYGFPAISSTGGAGTWHKEWARLFASVPRVVVIYDNDPAGRQGAMKVRASIRRAELWQWPDGYKDGGEFLPTENALDWLYQRAKADSPTPL